MGKRDKHFQKIAEFKERFRNLSDDQIRRRMNVGYLIKEAAIAMRELLEERCDAARKASGGTSPNLPD